MSHLHTVENGKAGIWERQAVVAEQKVMRVVFKPGPDDGLEHTGFVMMAAAERSEWQIFHTYYTVVINTLCGRDKGIKKII